MSSAEPIIELRNISKQFGHVQALTDVSLHVRPQTIHAVVGENGAGKTTLMKILQGFHQPDAGEISLDGKPVTFPNNAASQAQGIGMVSQHYSIIPELTCLQNLMLGCEPGLVLPLAAAATRADTLAAEMGFQFDWASPAYELSPAAGQKLEVLKLLWRNARIMILDEPTAMLSPSDSDAMYASLRQLVSKGTTVIVVTHRIPEVLEHCQNLTVLRGGKLIEERPVEGLSGAQIAELIVGRSVATASFTKPAEQSDPVLEVRDLEVLNDQRVLGLKGASLKLFPGEVVGLAGVDGNGQQELFRALMGRARIVGGSVTMAGEDTTKATTREILASGVRLIPEDRHTEGCIETWSLIDNAILGSHRKPREESRESAAERMATRFRTKFGSLSHPLKSLSGGNQQRFIAGRALDGSPRLILAFQPTRGLDIASTEEVYSAIREECRRLGAAALVVSFDLDELLAQCDRVVAICHGHLVEPSAELAMDRAEIGRLMVGA